MPKLQLRYIRNPHQKEFHDDVKSKFLHMSTGFGGGKTYAIAMKALQLSILNKDIAGGCVAPTLVDFKKDLLPIFEEILESNNVDYRYHKGEYWFRFPWSRAKMYVVSADKKIRGPNWGWAVINESTLISHESYKEVIGRVRIKRAQHPQVASSGTPEGTSHWKYEVFITNPMKNSRVIYGDTRDNSANLNEDYILSLESSYDSIMLDAYLRGMWVNMNGNRFYYAYGPHNEDKSIRRIDGERVHVSLDFNVDPMCATLWHVKPYVNKQTGMYMYDPMGQPMKECLAFEQIELKATTNNTRSLTEQMCDALRARGCDPDSTTIYPDPAGNARSTKGQPDTVILRQCGFHDIRMRAVAPDFRRRQLSHNNLLEKRLIRLNPLTCPGLKRDYEAVEQDIATYQKIKDNPKLTHFSDGADYMMDLLFPLSGTKPNSRNQRIR